jgi:hypothetical protein
VIETTPIRQIRNYFWMQFAEYGLKKYFELLKHHQKNPSWHQNSKWRHKAKKYYFCCQIAKFSRIFKKNCVLLVLPVSIKYR